MCLNKTRGDSVEMKLFKSVLCLIMVFLIVLSAVGCKTKQSTTTNGQYTDSKGNVVDDENVTLDVIANREYKKNFDDLKKTSQRQQVVAIYLDHHLPTTDEYQKDRKKALIDQLSNIEVDDINLSTKFENGLGMADSILSDATAGVALADFYAKAKDDLGFEKFIEKVDKSCKVADFAIKFSKACLIMVDLSKNDISNKQEYCDTIIDSLSFIVSFVPVFDDYFTESLSVVNEGMQLVIKRYEERKNMLNAYFAEIDNSSFFATEITVEDNKKIQFAYILNSQYWNEELAPSIRFVLERANNFTTIKTDEQFTCLREYLLYRVSYERENPQPEYNLETVTPSESCTHLWSKEYVSILKEATCIEEGIELRRCSYCGTEKEFKIEMIDHDLEKNVKAPTYESIGYTEYTCKNCDYRNVDLDSVVDALPLLPPDISESSTWQGKGIMHYTHNRNFKVQVYNISEDYISGYLEVYRTDSLGVKKYTHKTKFHGEGKKYKDGYEYFLIFDTPVTVGTIPTFTYTDMPLLYNSKEDTFIFDAMYSATMRRN